MAVMDVVHGRCAGLDISKKDAKVCVRVAGHRPERATTETVTTWGATTNQVLALREHLMTEQVTCVVMEATGDYWKPFFYLLEDAGFEVLSSRTPGMCRTCLAVRPMLPMQHGWLSSGRTDWFAARSSPRSRSGCCVI